MQTPIRYAAGLVAVLLAIGLAAAAPPRPADPLPVAVVTFRDQAVVEGDRIVLADVAIVETVDAALEERLAAIVVGRAPAAGFRRTVSARYSRLQIRVAGIPLEQIEFAGEDVVQVTRASQTIDGRRIFAAVSQAVEALVEGAIAMPASAPRDVVAPLGAVEILASGLRPPTPNLINTVGVTVLVDGATVARPTVSFRLVVPAPAMVAVRDLPRGTFLAPEDFRRETRPTPPGDLVLNEDTQLFGMETTRDLKAGDLFTRALVRPAVLVKRQERCQLTCRGNGFVVNATAKALQDGALGQSVRAINLTSNAEVTGVVVGLGQLRVDF